MNNQDRLIRSASEKVSFTNIQKYLQNRSWEKRESKRHGISIFFKESHHGVSEIILPTIRDFGDYQDTIIKIFEIIAKEEKSDIIQVIHNLMVPPSDIVRFRVNNPRTELGLISITEGFSLLENAKKSLFVAACDLVQPALLHKRMSFKSAQQFIESCLLGQTEQGSFIASVVCPFINDTADELPTQLTLFDSEESLRESFTRKVTARYMRSLTKVKTVIESGNHDKLEDPDEPDLVSANFIESLVELGEYGDKDEIEISTSWSYSAPEAVNIPKSVTFTKDYISPMQSILKKLKTVEESKEGVFIGKISKAQAEADASNRSEGEVYFKFLSDDDKIVNAKVSLSKNDFDTALQAFKDGSNVRISGKLQTSGKTKIIEAPRFELL